MKAELMPGENVNTWEGYLIFGVFLAVSWVLFVFAERYTRNKPHSWPKFVDRFFTKAFDKLFAFSDWWGRVKIAYAKLRKGGTR